MGTYVQKVWRRLELLELLLLPSYTSSIFEIVLYKEAKGQLRLLLLLQVAVFAALLLVALVERPQT